MAYDALTLLLALACGDGAYDPPTVPDVNVIVGGGKVPDALYQAFKPLWDGPEAA